MLPSVFSDIISSVVSPSQVGSVTTALGGAASENEALARLSKLSGSSDLTDSQIQRLRFLFTLTTISGNGSTLVKNLAADSSLQTPRDVALSYNDAKLASLYGATPDPPSGKLGDEAVLTRSVSVSVKPAHSVEPNEVS